MQLATTGAVPKGVIGPGPVSNEYAEFLEAYYGKPVEFCEDIFGVQLEDWQAEVMRAVVVDGERRVSIRSGHGVGKTGLFGMLSVYGMVFYDRINIVATAPSKPQLEDGLFAQIKIWFSRLPAALRGLFDVRADRIVRLSSPEECYFAIRTSRAETPDALQGIHIEGGVVWLIADEAAGIPEKVFEAASGSMSGHNCTTLLAGNPTKASGFFFDTHHKLRSMWRCLQVSCVGSKRVAQDFITDMLARYGEDSNAYRARVLGEFPNSDDDTLISLELVEAAKVREIDLDPKARKVWGLDPARFGDDSAALCKRWGKVVPEPIKPWRKLDTMQLTGAVLNEWNNTPIEDRPYLILVDVIGIGAGVVDRLRELNLPVRGINVSESPSFGGKYVNLRAELWDKGKKWLSGRDCRLPADERLTGELTLPRYKFASNGNMQIESKDDMKRRGLKSTDYADAFLLTLADDAAVGYGAPGTGSIVGALKRKLKGVV
jgi:phage terminase large subunit